MFFFWGCNDRTQENIVPLNKPEVEVVSKDKNSVSPATKDIDLEPVLKITEPSVEKGLLCVAPLDYSPTPGKGSSKFYNNGSKNSWPVPRKNRVVLVLVDDTIKEIDLNRGASFEGLSITDKHIVKKMTKGSNVPFFQMKVDFKKERSNALCLYDNAFYGSTRLSDKPRRLFCRRCFNNADN